MSSDLTVSKDQPPILAPKAQEPKSSCAGCYIALVTIGSIGLMVAGVGAFGFCAGGDLRTYSIILMGTGGSLAVGLYGTAAMIALVRSCIQRAEKKGREEKLLGELLEKEFTAAIGKTEALWKSDEFHGKIQSIQKNELQKKQERENGYKSLWFGDNSLVTVTMLSGETFVTKKENLGKCVKFKTLYTNSKATDNKLNLALDIPDEILSYITSNSEEYKNAPVERMLLLLPVIKDFDIPELLNHFKLQICKSLLEAKEQDQESEFRKICRVLGTEIDQWLNG